MILSNSEVRCIYYIVVGPVSCAINLGSTVIITGKLA